MVARLVGWAENMPDIRALALVGSYARGAERTDSDIDLIVLTTSPARYASEVGWVSDLDLGLLVQTRAWGAITERRLRLPNGLEIELGFGGPDWASINPLDPGTRGVVIDGMQSLYDPDGLLGRLQSACS